MKNNLLIVLIMAFALGTYSIPETVWAEKVLERINKTGEVRMGFRKGSNPFGYLNDKGEWVGFGVDIGKEILAALNKKLGKPIQLTRVPVKPENRMEMIIQNAIDISIGSASITLAREKKVDFSHPYFLTGARLLVSMQSPIRSFIPDLADKRVGLARGATGNIAAIDWLNQSGRIQPKFQKVLFDEHDQGFQALQQGAIAAYCTDESILAGMKASASNPRNWKIVGNYLTYEAYGMILPQNQSEWRDFVNATLVNLIKSGRFKKIHAKWFGPYGKVPLPMSNKYKTLLNILNFPD